MLHAARLLGRGFTAIMILAGTTGLSCDSNASAAFRETAAGTIGEGVKTILDGVIDGLIAAIQQAGDGSSADSSTDSSTSSGQ